MDGLIIKETAIHSKNKPDFLIILHNLLFVCYRNLAYISHKIHEILIKKQFVCLRKYAQCACSCACNEGDGRNARSRLYRIIF